jgi:hypothetical protein
MYMPIDVNTLRAMLHAKRGATQSEWKGMGNADRCEFARIIRGRSVIAALGKFPGLGPLGISLPA